MLNLGDDLIGTWRGSTGQSGFWKVNYETTFGIDQTFATNVRSFTGHMRTTGTFKVVNGNMIEFVNQTRWPSNYTVQGGKQNGWSKETIYPTNIGDKDSVFFQFLDRDTLVIQSTVPGIAPMTCKRGALSQSMSGFNLLPVAIQAAPNEKLMLYLFLIFIVISTVMAFMSLPQMH